jgi:selenocysteine-specific elongation factor
MAPAMSSTPSATATRLAIVGTAGHIDHGKTALVKRLTGVDTDRLPEEKARGISIDLGFARLVTPAGVHVGIVDVPGHERFVKNMLAGIGGIDLVLLVIAADEGVMPQTREHLAIVRLLGIRRAVVALTKADLVEPDWIDLVRRDVTALLADTPFADAPMVEFSAVSGAGERELLQALDLQLASLEERSAAESARLPVDRVFIVEGFGTVVTGTLWRGRIRTGDALDLLPGGLRARARRIQVHGATVEEARAGQRTAVAIHGIAREQVARGDWLIEPGSLRPSRVLDVRFELLPEVTRPWKTSARVRFHLGAAEYLGRLVLLEGAGLAPGGSALAQVRLDAPAVAARGDRFVIRAWSPTRTVGGGTVIEPQGRKRRRHAGLDALALRESGSLEARVMQQLEQETRPVAARELARALSESEGAVAGSLDVLRTQNTVAAVGERWVAAGRWAGALDGILRAVGAYVARHPARYGIPKGELKSGLQTALDAALFDAAFDALVLQGVLVARGERVRPGAEPWTPPAQTVAALRGLEQKLESAGFAVPENVAWQAALGAEASEVLALGTFEGRLVRVSQELTYTAGQIERLRVLLRSHFAAAPALGVAAFKDLTGVSRKYAVPLLEYTDRIGWTQRLGDERRSGAKLS